MAPGQRRTERQQKMWVATAKLPASIGHVFYAVLNSVLRDGHFDPPGGGACARSDDKVVVGSVDLTADADRFRSSNHRRGLRTSSRP